jgi:hypothetical protein
MSGFKSSLITVLYININECRSYLSEEASIALSDEELASLYNQIEILSEVVVDHALTAQVS